jgi:hypothetical protein
MKKIQKLRFEMNLLENQIRVLWEHVANKGNEKNK